MDSMGSGFDPQAENEYWRNTYQSRSYVGQMGYDSYGPAYAYGVEAFGSNRGRPYDEVEPELASRWDESRGTSKLSWEHAKHAVKDAWDRLTHAFDSDSKPDHLVHDDGVGTR
jgi:hypothetical protein